MFQFCQAPRNSYVGIPVGWEAHREFALSAITREEQEIVFLQETKLYARSMGSCKFKLGFDNCFSVDALRRSGGLCLLWSGEVDVVIKSYYRNHIDTHVVFDGSIVWRFMSIYGYPEVSNRVHTWNLIRSLHSMESVPWLLGCDFNELLHFYDKRGGRFRQEAQFGAF